MKAIKELITKLNEASYAYYNSGSPIMTDSEYDSLYSELERLEQETGIIYSNSPTQNVGTQAIDALIKIEHEFPMLSLAKCHTIEELRKFMGNHVGLLMLKMDGLTVRATYNNGKLIRLETRGNGYIGNDVTHLVGNFVNLPRQISHKQKMIVDGECIITYKDFERINERLPENQEKFKNPRNLASGTLAAKSPEDVFDRPLRFIAWRVIAGMNDEDSLYKQLITLSQLGFEIVKMVAVDIHSSHEETLGIMLNDMREYAKIVGYPIDGIVFAINSISDGYKLGSTAHHFNHSIAYKFEDDRYPTKVIDVEWTGGKTGVLTPTLVFEPVEIEGSTVQRASIHNVSIFKQLHPTKGCTAYIYKANQIIPQCDYCDEDGEEEFGIPTVCPICGASTILRQTNDAEFLVCSNNECSGAFLKKLSVFVGKHGFDIEGLSDATLEKFVSLGWIDEFADIFALKKHYNEMVKLDGFGARSSLKLINAIEKSRTITMDKLIVALSIPMIGTRAAKQIAEAYDYDWNLFISDLDKGEATKLYNIDGFGSIMVANIFKWYKVHKYNKSLFEEILFKKPSIVKEYNKNSSLAGKTICVTGKLQKFKNREELAEAINRIGAKEVAGVTKKTSYLLTNDKNSGSSKNKKAAELSIPIISEDEFIEMCGIEV